MVVFAYLVMGSAWHLQGALLAWWHAGPLSAVSEQGIHQAARWYPVVAILMVLMVAVLLVRVLMTSSRSSRLFILWGGVSLLGVLVTAWLSWQWYGMPIWTSLNFLFAFVLLLSVGGLWLSSQSLLFLSHYKLKPLRPWAVIACVLVLLQLMMGNWVNVQYAGLSCPSFPDCNGHFALLPLWSTAWHLPLARGLQYHGGVLPASARESLQMLHRYAALALAAYLSLFAAVLVVARRFRVLRAYGFTILLLLVLEIVLGVLDVLWYMPWPINMAHAVVGIMLGLCLAGLLYRLYAPLQKEK